MAVRKGETTMISWRDCANYAQNIERTYNCTISVYLNLNGFGKYEGKQLWSMKAQLKQQTHDGQVYVQEWKPFPTKEHKTVPALLFSLLYEVEAKLERIKGEAERLRQTAF